MPADDVERRAPPGPIDRELFFDGQRRHRRAARTFALIALVFAGLIGAGVTALFTPTLYLFAAIALRLGSFVFPLTPVLHTLHDVLQSDIRQIIRWLNGDITGSGAAVLRTAITLVLPSVVTVIGFWIVIYRTSRLAHARAALVPDGAREPRSDVIQELALSDVVSEMAIASGLTPPRVLVLDQPGANAGIVGTSPADAVVVISSGLLALLDREELEGVIADLLGSVGNGDLTMAIGLTSTLHTIGLVQAVLDAPFRQQSRRALYSLVRLMFMRRSGDARARQAAAALRRLAPGLDDVKPDDSGWRALVEMPVTVLKFAVLLYGSLLCGPFMGFLWKSRRYLADATAVQLTRDPDGLSRALSKLSSADSILPGSELFAQQFIVEGTRGAGRSSRAADESSWGWPVHPSIERRLRRLAAMGADVSSGEERERRRASRGAVALVYTVLALILVPLFGLLFVLTLLLVSVVNYVGAAIYLWAVLLLLR